MSTPLHETRRIEALERENLELAQRLAQGRSATAGHPRHVFLAITKAGLDEQGHAKPYPPPADGADPPVNAFPIVFLEPWFTPEEPGAATVEYNLGSETKAQAVACAYSNKYYADGTTVAVLYQRGKQKGQVGKWWIISAAGDEEQLLHFRLLEELKCGQSALATQIHWDKDEEIFKDGKTIRVFDDYGDRGVRGPSEYVQTFRGWAAPRGSVGDPDLQTDKPAPPEYSIVEIDHQAKFVEGLADSILDANSYLIILQRWYDGKKPPIIQVNNVRVVDQPGPRDSDLFFPRIPLGSYARVKAVWDPCAGEYRVWAAQQMSPVVQAVAPGGFCGDTMNVDIDPLFADPYCFSPFNLAPDPISSALNIYDLAGLPDDNVLLHWREDLQSWVIIQVEHHEVTFVSDVARSDQGSQSQSTNCSFSVQVKKRKAWAAICSTQDSSSTAVLTFTERGLMTDLVFEDCKLTGRFERFCVLDPGQDPIFQDALTVQCRDVVTDVFMDGDCMKYLVENYAFIAETADCCAGVVATEIICFEDCIPPSQ